MFTNFKLNILCWLDFLKEQFARKLHNNLKICKYEKAHGNMVVRATVREYFTICSFP